MSEGILFAIAAAISFGTSDTFASLVARRLGAIRSAAAILIVSFLTLLVLVVLFRPAMPSDLSWTARAALLGGLSGFAYLCLVNALRLGPISVVGPIGSSGGAIVVVLSVLILGQQPGPLEWLAVVVTTTGAVLVALVRVPGERPRLSGPGPLFAIAAVFGYAWSVIGLQEPIRAVGWLPVLVVWRGANVVVASAVLLATESLNRRRPAAPVALPDGDIVTPPPNPPIPLARPGALVVALLFAGLLESAGQGLRAVALNVAPAWLIGVVNPLGPIVVISAGVVLFGERLGASQWLGVVLVGLGLVLLALP